MELEYRRVTRIGLARKACRDHRDRDTRADTTILVVWPKSGLHCHYCHYCHDCHYWVASKPPSTGRTPPVDSIHWQTNRF